MRWPILAVIFAACAPSLAQAPPSTSTTTRVLLMLDDTALRARLAASLIDDGIAIVTSAADGPSHVILVVDGADGRVVVCRGAEATASVVPPGPLSLVELELEQRIKALTATTKPATSTTATAPRVGLDVSDTSGDPDFGAAVVAAVLAADVGLDPSGAVPTLCVVADDVDVSFGVVSAGAACATSVAVPRAGFDPAAVVVLLPKRPPPPVLKPTAPTPTPVPMAVRTVAPTPRSLGLGLGVLGRPLALDPVLLVDVEWWTWSQVLPGIDLGPMVRLGASVGATDGIGSLTIVEPMFAAGVAARGRIVEGVEVGVGVAVGVWGHGWWLADVDAGVTADPFVVVPASVAWWVLPRVGVVLGLDVGSAARQRVHSRDGVVGWQRDPTFAALTLGVRVNPD